MYIMAVYAPREIGLQFETYIAEFIANNFIKNYSMREIECTRQFGEKGIDHAILGDDFIVCIQDKWLSKTVCDKDATYFVGCCKRIEEKIKMQVVMIFLSNMGLSRVAYPKYFGENCQHRYQVFSENPEEILNGLHKILHSYGIYMWEDQNICVMMT